MEISLLSPDVIDQIAAGEVVERPSHLVKELVENALDAGASEVSVEYSLGGRFVRVTDNGKGVSKEDLVLALARHATSKIKVTEDLWSLNSFGFRGEALASIAAVSRLTFSSKRHGADASYLITSEFGRLGDVELTGGSAGTSVLVEELFNNVPARLKFLKSDSTESQQIKATLKAMALSHPHVTFRVEENQKLVLFYKAAESFLKRAEQVLEISPLYEGHAQREGVRARAVFTDPHTVQKTSKHIWLFAQGRWIQDRSLTAAVMEAYRNLLMHGEYPSAVVWVDVDPSHIDVNIHPTKSQVKFQDPSLAFRAVQASVRDTLEKAPWIQQKSYIPPSPRSFNQEVCDSAPTTMSFQDPSMQRTQFNQKSFSLAMAVEQAQMRERTFQSPSPVGTVDSMANSAFNSSSSLHSAFALNESKATFWSHLQVLGQAHLTYIVCQGSEGLVFVDQHAAHERVAFERLMSAWNGGRIDIQEFLFPLAVDLTPDKVEALEKNRDVFARLGLTLEPLGPATMGVRAAPLLLKDSVIGEALEKMAHEIVDQGGSFRLEKVIGDICATMACHSVVRAGQSLSLEQMQSLLKEMDEFPLSSFCPHGRPVSVSYSFYKLEKDFGRIV